MGVREAYLKGGVTLEQQNGPLPNGCTEPPLKRPRTSGHTKVLGNFNFVPIDTNLVHCDSPVGIRRSNRSQ